MYWPRDVGSASSSNPIVIPVDQALELFTDYNISFQLPKISSTVPSSIGDSWQFDIEVDMEQSADKCTPSILPMPPFLVNYPDISITPALLNSNAVPTSPVTTNNRVPQGVQVSPSVSMVPLNNQETKCNDLNESKNTIKRIASNPNINNRPAKIKKKSTAIRKKKEKKVDCVSLFNSSNPASSSMTKVPQELASRLTSKESTNLDSESYQIPNGIEKEYQLSSDGKLKVNHIGYPRKDDTKPTNDFLVFHTRRESIKIESPELVNKMIYSINMAIRKNCTREQIDTFVSQNSEFFQSFHDDSISETKDVLLTNSKSNPPNINNAQIMDTKNKSTNQIQPQQVSQQPCTSKQSIAKTINRPSTNNKQVNASPKIQQINPSPKIQQINPSPKIQQINPSPKIQQINPSPKIQQINTSLKIQKTNTSSNIQQTTKQNYIKPNVSNVQHSTMAAVKKIQPVNKQIIGNQQPSTSKCTTLVSVNSSVTSKKVISLPQSKPVELKKCSKCQSISEDGVCTSCRMSSQFKDVTMTLVDIPVAPVDNKSIIVIGTSDNQKPDLSNTTIEILDSDDDDHEIPETVNINEPIVNKIESKELLRRHIEKIRKNPKLIEEKLWNKELGIKDYFKFENCNIIQVGNYDTVASGDVLICLHGIRMIINNFESTPVTIDIQMENITKFFGFLENQPFIIFYTNNLAAIGIRFLLNMHDKTKLRFDPLSEDFKTRKILWSFNLKNNEAQQLERLMMKLPKDKYEFLSSAQAENIQRLTFPSRYNTEVKKKSQSVNKNCIEDDLLNTVMFRKTYSDKRVELKVVDYGMLSAEQFLNDKLLEFHLTYWYANMLSTEDHNRTYVFSTYFYTSLSNKGLADDCTNSYTRFQRVRKWTKNVNIFEKDFIVIPVNENYHWYMVIICFPYLDGPVYWDGTPAQEPTENDDFIDRNFKYACDPPERDEADGNTEDLWFYNINYTEKLGTSYHSDVKKILDRQKQIKQPCILVFDSLSGGPNRARVTATIRGWLHEEYRAKHNNSTRDFSKNIMKGGIIKVPQQYNFFDCALFVMHYFEKFFENPIVDYTFPITHLENWFNPDEVSKNCQKRKDMQGLIINCAEEFGFELPAGSSLPVIRYVSNKTKSAAPNVPQNNIQLHQIYNSTTVNSDDDIESYIDDEDDEGQDDEIMDEEEEENNIIEDEEEEHNLMDEEEYEDDGQYEQYPSSAYFEFDSQMDPTEYFPGEVEPSWSDEQMHVDNHLEPDSGEDMDVLDDYHFNDVDPQLITTTNQGHFSNSQLGSEDLRSYTNNFHTNYEDDSNDYDVDNGINFDDFDDNDDNDDNDDESNHGNQSINLSNRRQNQRFNHHN